MGTKRIGLSPNANHKTSQLNTYDIMNDLADRAKVIIQAGKSIDNYFENSIYILTISPDEWINNQWNIKDKNTIIDFAISDPHSLTSDLPIMSKMNCTFQLFNRFIIFSC